MGKLDIILFFTIGFLFGLSFLFMRIGVPEFGIYVFAGLRIELAAIVLFIFTIVKNGFNIALLKENIFIIVFNAIFNLVLPFSLFSYAATVLNAGASATINSLVPLVATILAHFIFSEKIRPKQFYGIITSFIGVIILFLPKLLNDFGSIYGAIAAFLACSCYAISINVTRKFAKGIDGTSLSTSSIVIAAIIMLPITVILFPEGPISKVAWSSVIAISILSTSLAYICLYTLLFRVGTAKTISSVLLVPLFATFFGYIFLDESIGINTFIGIPLVLLGASSVIFRKS